MFASRVLPPIQSPPSPPLPVATFFNVPRRYVKSNMQVGGDSMAASPTDDSKPPRSMRKTSRAHNNNNNNNNIPRSATAPDADGRAEQDSEPPSPVASPRLPSKRPSSLAYKVTADDLADGANSPPNEAKTPPSTTSSGAGANGGGPASVDFPTSVCLCQPEPKIPRPRNGESFYFCFLFFPPVVRLLCRFFVRCPTIRNGAWAQAAMPVSVTARPLAVVRQRDAGSFVCQPASLLLLPLLLLPPLTTSHR
jgi:hypothetical protein